MLAAVSQHKVYEHRITGDEPENHHQDQEDLDVVDPGA
jgi:hypothetical protein